VKILRDGTNGWLLEEMGMVLKGPSFTGGRAGSENVVSCVTRGVVQVVGGEIAVM